MEQSLTYELPKEQSEDIWDRCDGISLNQDEDLPNNDWDARGVESSHVPTDKAIIRNNKHILVTGETYENQDPPLVDNCESIADW